MDTTAAIHMQNCGNGTANTKSFFQEPPRTDKHATDATDALAALAMAKATHRAWAIGDCHKDAGNVGCRELTEAKHAASSAASAIVTYVALTGAATSELC